MKIDNTLQTVVSVSDAYLIKRLRCPGGWVVIVSNQDYEHISTVFVPDQAWGWEPTTTDEE